MVVSGSGVSVYDNLMRFKPVGLSPNGWAVLAGVSRTVWADMKRHDNPSRRTLDKLLAAAGSSLAEFEALRIGDVPAEPRSQSQIRLGDHGASGWRGAPLPPVPTFFSAGAQTKVNEGLIDCAMLDRSQVIDSVDRPAILIADRAAFALTMVDGTMWPRFRSGRRLLVSPRTPVAPGDDVLVMIGRAADDRELVLVGELVRRTGSVVDLRQFNPERIIRVEIAHPRAINRIIGEAY